MSLPSPNTDTPAGAAEHDALRGRIAELEGRLAESEETLDAIRSGEVDAVVVGEADQRRVFTLESADRPYRLLVEEMREGAITLSADGILLYCNHAFADLVGAPASQVMGVSFKQFLIESDEPIETLFDEGGRTEIVLKTASGEQRPANLSLSPLPTETGRLACGVVADLTEDKARARELEQAQEALRQSQKMEAMGRLTGGVAHDFNNLLTPIIGSLDMLHRRGIGGDREQRLISGALQSADRAKILVQRLLAFARRQPLKATAVDLGALLDGMGELVASTSGPQINIVVNSSGRISPALADPNQLEMAILNLAVNARDAMPEGGTLTLSARNIRIGEAHRSKLPPGDYVGLSVADTGIGMDEATINRAIEPFFSTKGVGKGTGLGLSMVHGLVSQLGGAMTLASEPELGTKVELYLPVSAQQPVASDADTDRSGVELPTAGVVLLVDDEATVRISTADMLTDLGFSVVEAASAGEALKLLEGGLRADMLLTDHLMPGMTGTELARKARERWPDCPILLISGFAEADGVAPDLPRLVKPFRQAELAEMIATLN